MKPYSQDNPIPDNLQEIFTKQFGNVENFKKEFLNAGKAVEGSGWVALMKDDENNLLITQIQNHNLLGINGFKPILVNDVWEHAYYLDYKNDRAKYLENWWNVVNWESLEI